LIIIASSENTTQETNIFAKEILLTVLNEAGNLNLCFCFFFYFSKEYRRQNVISVDQVRDMSAKIQKKNSICWIIKLCLKMNNTAVQIINHVSPFWSNLSFWYQNALKLQFYHLPKFGGETQQNRTT